MGRWGAREPTFLDCGKPPLKPATKTSASANTHRNFIADVTNDTDVCQLHWPADFETVSVKGSLRPKNPPSVCRNVPCLKVFSEKTHQALLNHPGMQKFQGVADTSLFIYKVLGWWKILNVKSKGSDLRLRDELLAVIHKPEDERLQTILKFGKMAKNMAGKQGRRQKQLTRDTAQAIFHTCNGLVQLCRKLLHEGSHEYVRFGAFSTDLLEKEFSKLPQGSGGTYFINIQQILEKSNIDRTRLLLSLNTDVLQHEVNEESGHFCVDCTFQLQNDERATEAFDNIEELEESVPAETKSVLVYIAGYVTRKEHELHEWSELEHTTSYYQKYGKYTDSLNRGGLNIPSDTACQWIIFCYILFNVVKNSTCSKSFTNISMMISEHFDFGMKENHGRIIPYIFFKNHCNLNTPRSNKEPALKMLKLS